jgi:hopanoid biosynthesis associated RND transporter like protein HpnN
MPKALISSIVDFCARRPWLVLGVAALLSAVSMDYSRRHFAINTDINKLISPDLPWRQREIAFSQAFPQQDRLILAVVDGPTPETASSAADRLAAALEKQTGPIRGVRQSTDGPFFRQNGLLFLDDEQLKQTLADLQKSAGLFGTLSSDPSLRGVMNTITLSANAVQARRVTLNTLAPQLNAFAATVEEAQKGKPAPFSWQRLIGTSSQPGMRDNRQLIEIDANLDFNDLEPGSKATQAIRSTVADLKLADEGVTVRLTGPVRIADEEFASIKEGALLNGIITFAAVVAILWFALHSVRIIFAVQVALAVGLAITAGAGLLLVGSFNPISIAFFVLFVGIGVDFGLQYSVGYRAARYEKEGLHDALVTAARDLGGRLALAALATAAGFLSFTPTAYRGLSELGLVAGVGMLIAFAASITVLPALLKLLNPRAEAHPLGYAALAPVDRFLDRHRVAVLVLTLYFVIAALPLLAWLKFDLNPMNLRNPQAESIATFTDLRKDAETAGRTIEALEPTLEQADALAKRVSALPEVSRVLTISSFVPANQDAKIAQIRQAAQAIDPMINPQQVRPAPTPDEVTASIETAASSLQRVSNNREGEGAQAASRLATALTALAKAAPEVRQRLEAALIAPFKVTLDTLKASLNPQPVTLASLPDDVAGNWRAADGRMRVSISPKGDAGDNEVLRQFVESVTSVAPNAAGEAVGTQRAGEAIVMAFKEAAAYALISIAILLFIFLRSVRDVALTLFPLILAAVVTLELCVAIGLPLNFANIIALPLLLGVGVAFKIYYIIAWRDGQSGLLASPLTRAVFYSGLTTAVAFGSLWFSSHPGTSSMGELLALSLVTTMAAAVLFQPLLMGPPQKVPAKQPSSPAKAKAKVQRPAPKVNVKRPVAQRARR